MRTEPRSASKLTVLPSPLGWSVLAGAAVLFALMNQRQIAVGFLVPLALFFAIDAIVSVRRLVGSGLRLQPTRSVAAEPSRVTFAIDARPGRVPLALRLGKLTQFDEIAPWHVVRGDDVVVAGSGTPTVKGYVRYRTIANWLGLVEASRMTVQVLASPLYRAVGPRPLDTQIAVGADDVARIREYIPGDRYSRVSWPLTARTGRLHVRSPGPDAEEIVIVLDLGIDFADTAGIVTLLQWAADMVGHFLERGLPVRLVTREMRSSFFEHDARLNLDRPQRVVTPELTRDEHGWISAGGVVINDRVVSELVIDEVDLARRIAAADLGPPPPSPPGPHLYIHAGGVEQR